MAKLDPFGFDHLVKRLPEEISYDNVEVTSPSGDGGVDVVATIELGITSVREVVQAKRHRRTIQRKDLDVLRGCLHRFGAVRGALISTARYSKGTREAAFEPGAAPITLIEGEKLIDSLIEHGIGVQKKPVEGLELDANAFADFETAFVEGEEGEQLVTQASVRSCCAQPSPPSVPSDSDTDSQSFGTSAAPFRHRSTTAA